MQNVRSKPDSPLSDPDVTALLLTAYGLAPLVLQSHLARGLGVDPLSPEGARIMAIPGLELLTREALQRRFAAGRRNRGTGAGHGASQRQRRR